MNGPIWMRHSPYFDLIQSEEDCPLTGQKGKEGKERLCQAGMAPCEGGGGGRENSRFEFRKQ